jgi:putative two-component system response regulator
MDDSLKQVLIVDDSTINISIIADALNNDYEVLTAESAIQMFKLLEDGCKPDIILLDVLMPQMSGYEAIVKLKKDPATEGIPVIFLTALDDTQAELKGLDYGAVDYISKPIYPALLAKRVSIHLCLNEQKYELEEQKRALAHYNANLENMVKKQTRAVLDLQYAILSTIGNIVEFRDDITGNHNQNVTAYLYILIEGLREFGVYTDELDSWDIPLVCQSAQLHDVGKIAISDTILLKPGRLTVEEFEEMKKHTTLGEMIIERIGDVTNAGKEFLAHASVLAGMHHEKWDGTGYPRGLADEKIPLEGRLMALVDVYDALIAVRPYKKSFTHEEAIALIQAESGTHFDPTLVQAFNQFSDRFQAIAR